MPQVLGDTAVLLTVKCTNKPLSGAAAVQLKHHMANLRLVRAGYTVAPDSEAHGG